MNGSLEMSESWNQLFPLFQKTTQNSYSISHNHHADPKNRMYYGKGKTISEECISMRGCIAFFKSYTNESSLTPEERAQAACIAAEDQARLEVFEKYGKKHPGL